VSFSPIILIVGGPGAGKSSAARLVAEYFDRSIYHEADTVRESVVKGFAVPQMPYSAGNLEQFALGRTVSTFLAQRYSSAGFAVVVDDTFACHVASGYATLMADRRTLPVFLAPTKQALVSRMEARGGPFDEVLIGLVENGYDKVMEEIDLSMWTVIDNTALSVDETANAIIELATQRG
jgi:predicted kinase